MIKIKLNENIVTTFQDFLKIKEFKDYNHSQNQFIGNIILNKLNFLLKINIFISKVSLVFICLMKNTL